MKKLSFLIFILVAPFFVGGFYWFYRNSIPISTDISSKYFLITKGASASQIGSSLEKSGFIKSALAFRIYVKFSGNSKKILAGEYRLSPSFSLSEIVDQFLRGPEEIWVTIPEGLNNEKVVEKFISALHPPDSETFRKDFLNLAKNKQGYLFPDTYLFPLDATPGLIVSKMLTIFDQKVGDISLEKIIMASLIEEETKTDLERPIVAGILYKRLKAGWLLQVDVAPETYKKLGLPQAPIANPGLASIKAVISPEDSPYWYYLHDLNGAVHYAKTLEEHNQNIRQYLSP